MKMSTALTRDAHFQGLMGLDVGPNTYRNRKLGTICSRDDLGSQLGGMLVDFGLQNGPQNETNTLSKMRSRKDYQNIFSTARNERVGGSACGLRPWTSWKTGGAFTTPFPPGTRPGGGGSMCVALPPAHIGGCTLYVGTYTMDERLWSDVQI